MLFQQLVRTKFIHGFGHLSRSSILTSNVPSSMVCSSRWMSVEDKRGVGLGPKKKKQSEITFSPLVPSDEFLERRKQSFVDKIASIEGQTKAQFPWRLFWYVLLGGFGGFAVKVLPNSHLKDFVQSILQHYEPDGSKTKISNHLEDLILDVVDDVGVTTEELLETKVFINSSDDNTSTLGGYKFFSKGLTLGFPVHLNYSSLQDVPIKRLCYLQKPLNPELLESPEAKDFLTNLILSDEAKKFVIARELYRGIKSRHALETVIPFLTLAGISPFLARLAQGLNLKKKPVLLRGIAGLGGGLIIAFWYFFIVDWWKRITERALDAAACQLGPAYARGGVEFYDKMMRRRVALREFLPDGQGKKMYNLKGEIFPPLIRNKFIPIGKRREFCRTLIESESGI